MPENFSYDEVPYPSKFFVQTHPDRLAAAGLLYGMQPSPVESCRVLELGCGNGSNLISHAYGLPSSRFVGVDLSQIHIDQANSAVKELELSNIEFRKMDVMEMSVEDFGRFDYITAHGLFSWIPGFVREKVLSLFNELLEPNGIGYISYNAYPGAYAREMVRSLMRFHTYGIDDPEAKVEKAISLLELLAKNATEPEVYQRILNFEFRRHQQHDTGDIFHDDLGEDYRPFYFYEIASLLKENGMQFLSEAELHASSRQGVTAEYNALLDSLETVEEREQYLDMLRGRVFRQTLFCRSEIKLDRIPKPDVIEKFYLSSSLRPVEQLANIGENDVQKFANARGHSMQIVHPITKAAIAYLGEIWGGSIKTSELLDAARQIVENAGGSFENWDDEFETARSILLRIVLESDLIELHAYAPYASRSSGMKPKVNRLSLWQLRDANHVFTLLNKDLKLEDKTAHYLLDLMDGTRTKMKLVTDMQAYVRSADGIDDKQQIIRDMSGWIDESVAELERLGLFETQPAG
jgi:SAM-dependent methyltransferase